jgi:hypothetical protein
VYDYEVFLSYRRRPHHSQWLVEHFVPLFENCLIDEVADRCQRAPDKLFLDVEEVQPGTNIPSRVRDGIKRARCLVALVSPMYFRSRWCLVEWESFKTRGQSENRDLVVPAILHGGTTVRTAVRDTMWADFEGYHILGSGFTKTAKYVSFQREIKKLAKRVGEIVASAPDWKDEFNVCDPPSESISPDPKTSLMRLG